jgi:hypothetical protein
MPRARPLGSNSSEPTPAQLDGVAERLYDTWREPPSLTWRQIVQHPDGAETVHFVTRWRRVARVVIFTAQHAANQAS